MLVAFKSSLPVSVSIFNHCELVIEEITGLIYMIVHIQVM